jgi:OTU domain-containing protein 6
MPHFQLSAAQLRQMAADFIRKNCWDFLPFLVTEEGTPLVESDLPDYCTKVANMCSRGGSWGGEAEVVFSMIKIKFTVQLQLRAISSALQRRIEVLHADDRTTVFGEHFPSERESPLLITFHKHAYTLGEHYNSTAPADN